MSVPLLRMFREDRRLQLLLAALLIAAVAVGVVLSRQSASAKREPSGTPSLQARAKHRVAHFGQASHPNIVFVLTDDLASNLVQYMPHVLAMEQGGMTFKNFFVTDSLCCPSRSSIFTGDFPHDTGVYNNVGTNGGFGAFYARGDENHMFASVLQRQNYETALMGKFLNGYLQTKGAAPVPDTYIAPGWNEWDAVGYGYPEYSYPMNANGQIVQYGTDPSDYLTDVIAGKGINFINTSVAAGKPFFLELATFAPHSPYTPAPEDVNAFPGLLAPRDPSFNVLPSKAPRWLAGHPPLTAAEITDIDQSFRLRAQSVQDVDRMIGEIETTLAADGVSGNTYIVFSSDNGYHMGEYRLTPGKLTAFDTDIHVPLVVTGPGVPANVSTSDVTENIDLADTFAAIAGTSMQNDGASVLPLLKGQNPSDWRDAALIEHKGTDLRGIDPDYQQTSGGSPRTYEAMRTPDFLYVEYDDGEREFYNLKTDPFELHNIANTLTPYESEVLHVELSNLKSCHGPSRCWAAGHVSSAQQLGQAAAVGP